MKKYNLLSLLFLFSTSVLLSQAGRWEGTLEVSGMKLDMIIELEEKNNKWSGTLDIPVQNVKNMALEKLVIEKDAIAFQLPQVPGNASYEGNFKDDFSLLKGVFQQGGLSLPLEMTKRDVAVDLTALENYKMLVDSLMQELKVAGMGVGIVKGGKVILAEGFGYRDYENKVQADANTIFAIGSSSKAFTTMGLGLLADDDQLDWNKPIIEYLPDFRLMDDFATQEMTATDLVTHQSGLPRHDIMWYATDFDRQDLYKRLRYLEPTKSFRTTFQYQNLMYMTAGVLIEELSGTTWEAFTQKEIFQPLGMKRSNLSVDDTQKQENYALPYRVKDEAITKMDFRNIDAIGPAGSINSTVNDMLKWVQLHLDLGKFEGKELVSETTVKKMHTPHKTMIGSGTGDANFGPSSYGLGWFISNYGDTYFVQHGGNIDGFSALVVLLPKEDIGMVFLSNQNGSRVPGLSARYAMDMLLEKDAVDWYKPAMDNGEEEKEEEESEEETAKRTEGTSPHHELKAYAGMYENEGYGKVEITQDGDQLKAKYYEFEMPMQHWHFETFEGEVEELGYKMKFTFQTDFNGQIVSVAAPFEPATKEIVFKKLPPDLMSDPEFLGKLVGDYELSGMTAKVQLKGKILTVTIPGQPPYTLVPQQGKTFALKGLNGYNVEFTMEEEAKHPKELVFYQPNGTFKAKRVEES
ncbi:MAG: serine hydrolase [Bacteroidota bacterium]